VHLDDGGVRTQRRVDAADAGDPGLEGVEHPREGLDLAHSATSRGVALVQVRPVHVVLLRAAQGWGDPAQRKVVTLLDGGGGVEGFREVVPGVAVDVRGVGLVASLSYVSKL